jgi:hypothetical protein
MSWRWLPILMISLGSGCDSAEVSSKFAGTYSGEDVTLQIDGTGPKHEGHLVVAGQKYALKANVAGRKLTGSFEVEGEAFALEATFDGDVLELTSGGKTRRMQRQGSESAKVASREPEAANPLGALNGDSASDDDSASNDDSASTPIDKEEPNPPEVVGFGGNFTGKVEGIAISAKMDVQGDALSGVIDVGGEKFKLKGKVDGNKATGRIRDPQNGGDRMKFRGKLNGKSLVLTIKVPDTPGMVLRFKRRGSVATGARTNSKAAATSKEEGSSHNPALVGTWSKTTSMGSGGASFSSKEYMRVFRNGRYQVGAGQAVAGGAGWSMGSDNGVEITGSGKWKTQGTTVLINEGSGWQAIARFYVEGNRLMFTLGDGSRQVWHRE